MGNKLGKVSFTMSSPVYERRHHVQQMRANFALEELLPDSDDMALQSAYIAGELGLHEMWAHALAFALVCAVAERNTSTVNRSEGRVGM